VVKSASHLEGVVATPPRSRLSRSVEESGDGSDDSGSVGGHGSGAIVGGEE